MRSPCQAALTVLSELLSQCSRTQPTACLAPTHLDISRYSLEEKDASLVWLCLLCPQGLTQQPFPYKCYRTTHVSVWHLAKKRSMMVPLMGTNPPWNQGTNASLVIPLTSLSARSHHSWVMFHCTGLTPEGLQSTPTPCALAAFPDTVCTF